MNYTNETQNNIILKFKQIYTHRMFYIVTFYNTSSTKIFFSNSSNSSFIGSLMISESMNVRF